MSVVPWAEGVPGLRVLGESVTAWSLSPDDGRLALAWSALDGAGRTRVEVFDLERGASLMRAAGAEVGALLWVSPDLLLVTRAQAQGCRAVLHSVAEGRVVSSVALPALPPVAHELTRASMADRDLVAALPRRWIEGGASSAKRRVGYLLRAGEGRVLRELSPSAWDLPPRSSAGQRAIVMSLDPEGESLVAWLSDPQRGPGHLVRYHWSEERVTTLIRAGESVVEVLECDPTRVVLRSAEGDAIADRGDLTLVDLQRGAVLRDTREGDDLIGPWATLDLHPDRERVLVAGRRAKGARWVGTLRAIDVGDGRSVGALSELATSAERVMGAVWGDDDEVFTLTTRGSDRAQLARRDRIDSSERPTCLHELSLGSRSVTRGALRWGGARARLVASWRCVPPRADVAQRALGVARIAVIDAR